MDLSPIKGGSMHVRGTIFQIAHHMALLGKAECVITEDQIIGNIYRFNKTYPIKREANDKFHFYTSFDVKFNPYPTEFPYGNGMVLHFYQQQESSTTKTVHKVINKRLKTYV